MATNYYPEKSHPITTSRTVGDCIINLWVEDIDHKKLKGMKDKGRPSVGGINLFYPNLYRSTAT
jgi:hypothetical protein